MRVVPYKKRSFIEKCVLSPFALLYSIILHIRHFLFDKGLVKTTRFNFPVLVVGNLAVGGTGKTPFTAYLCELLKDEYTIATLSRGYKRRTSGYYEVTSDSIHSEVGDEPSWLKKRFPDVGVYVCESRVLGLSYLLQDKPFLDAVIFDDAFQHRKMRSDMNIVLCDYANMAYEDRLLPLGMLRDIPASIKRAAIVVVTKCPDDISIDRRKEIERKLKLRKDQQLYFSSIQYGRLYPIINNSYTFGSFYNKHILLITGIANPSSLIAYLEKQQAKVYHKAFSDHFHFTYEDIINMIAVYDSLPAPKIILFTEKDAVKMERFSRYWKHLPVFVIPIRTIIRHEEEKFIRAIKNYIDSF